MGARVRQLMSYGGGPEPRGQGRTRRSPTGSDLERNRAGDLECVPLKGRSALEFMKILSTDAHLLLR